MERKFGVFSSSEDPQKLAATVVGLIRLAAGMAVTFGLLTQVDGNTIIEQMMIIVPAGYAVYGGIETVFGIGRKCVIALIARFS